jgi:L-rhamnose mutarotase
MTSTIDSAEVQPRKRIAFTLRLREGAAEAYEKAHREVGAEMREMLKRGGISEYSIFRRDNLLFLTFKAVDFEATWSQFDNDPVNLRWQKAMAPLFAPHEGLRPGERFPMMEEVFFCPES